MCLILVSALLVIGCEKGDSSSKAVKEKQESEVGKSLLSIYDIEEFLPLVIEEGNFGKVYGWLDNQTLVYSTMLQNSSNIYAYHLKTGTSTLLLKVESMIDSIHISHSGNYLLIRSTSEASPSKITVITNKGKIVFSEVLENAFDAAVVWNPYDEDKVLISSFTDDWQETTFILSIKMQQMTELDVVNPFSYWISKNKLIYLNSHLEDQSGFADVVMKDLSNGKEIRLLSDVFQLDSFHHFFLTITADKENLNDVIYSFYNQKVKFAGSITMPKLASFTDWLIPYYDYNEEKETFISFKPLKSGTVDSYNEDFQLIQYKMGSETNTVIIDGLNNEPISCNQEGNLCLYGYFFEKLIDMKNKEIIHLY
ncbi:YqgU-like beta propeller domain-containing protein [Niallia endozanthoxylica]|uniref:YqgU-like 6-bladed beta-propeller domain-containing protein n=1 Tax=Niallia endozanthoxylica TaxID=2036016 RepID=A0A5J5HWL4_9BACI|nr:hypothetical protein [Niallia endozanthoxylica]KAA9026287.1 hypothetical protein F4V44_10490 [Niallia endozanthoxylica]